MVKCCAVCKKQFKKGANRAFHKYRRDLDYLQEWHCKSRIKRTDLDPDYFPRYLRSVESLAENCWFNIYKLEPRSFTVKVLKQKPDRCKVVDLGSRIIVASLHNTRI